MSGLVHERVPDRAYTPDSTPRNQLANSVANLTHNGGLAVYNSIISGPVTLGHDQSSQDNLRRRYLARYSAVNPTHIHNRIVSKKDKLLDGSTDWVFEDAAFKSWDSESEDTNILWIHGNAGKGKTMILISAIAEMQRRIKDSSHDDLLLYFFCAHEDQRLNDARSILQGLIFGILTNKAFCNVELFDYLLENDPLDATSARPQPPGESESSHTHQDPEAKYEDDLAKYWMILIGLLDLLSARRIYILVDALDECDRGLVLFLDRVIRCNSRARIRWLMTSRNEPEIAERLERDSDSGLHMSLELNAANVSRSVREFVQVKVKDLSRRKRYDEETEALVTKELRIRSQDTFLWVALAYRQLSCTPIYAVKQALLELPEGLTALYNRMLNKAINTGDSFSSVRKSMLQTALTAFRPMSVLELAAFIDMPNSSVASPRQIEQLVDECASFLVLEGNIEPPQDCLVVFVHLSAAEFISSLTQKSQIEPAHRAHRTMAHRALQILGDQLDGSSLDVCNAEITSSERLNNFSLSVRHTPVHYATQYWTDHTNLVANFHGFPYSPALRAVYQNILAPFQWEAFGDACRDASLNNFYSPVLLEHRQLPPFVFYSLLDLYTGYLVNGTSSSWNKKLASNAVSARLEWLHVDEVFAPHEYSQNDLPRIPDSVRCSTDGSLVALLSENWPIYVFRIRHGQSPLRLTLAHSPRERGYEAMSTFSPCSNQFAACGSDCDINLWSFGRNEDGEMIQRHMIWDGSTFVFSDDGKLIACGRDKDEITIRIFKTQTGRLHAALAASTSGQTVVSKLLKLSPDKTFLVESIHVVDTDDSGILLWRIDTGEVVFKLSPMGSQRKPSDAAFCAIKPILAIVDNFARVQLIAYSTYCTHELTSPKYAYEKAPERTTIAFLPASTILITSTLHVSPLFRKKFAPLLSNAVVPPDVKYLTLFDIERSDIRPYRYSGIRQHVNSLLQPTPPSSLLHDLARAHARQLQRADRPNLPEFLEEMLAQTPSLHGRNISTRDHAPLIPLSPRTDVFGFARNTFILGQRTSFWGKIALRRVHIDVEALKRASKPGSHGSLPRRDIGDAGRAALITAWDDFEQELAQAKPMAESEAESWLHYGLLSGSNRVGD